MSKNNQLNVEDLKRRGRDLLVFLAPILIIVLDNIENQDFDTSIKMFVALTASASLDLLRRFLTNYK